MGSTLSPGSYQGLPLLVTAHAQGTGHRVECFGIASFGGDYFDPQFTDEDAESQGERACPGKLYSSGWDFNPSGRGLVL